MKERKVKKLLKRIIKKDIFNKIENHFTFEKKYVNIYKKWCNCRILIKEQPHIAIGITNITNNRDKNNKDTIFYVAPRYSFDKFSPTYCKEDNIVNGIENINEFIYIIHQCCNDFVGKMIYQEETEDEFWENYNEAKNEKENGGNWSKNGLDSEEYQTAMKNIKNLLKNLDYDKIDILIINLERQPFFRRIGTVYFYPNWKNCDDKFIEDFEKYIETKCKLSSFQWRPFDIQKKKKRDRKKWMVYTKEGNRSLFKYLKEKSV